MKLNNIATVVLLIVLTAAGVVFGNWLSKPTIDDLADRNLALARADSVRTVELEDSRIAYQKIVRDYRNAEKAWAFVNDSLGEVANALRRKAIEDGRTIEVLITANGVLRDSLDAVVNNITVTDSTVTAELYSYKKYQDGSIGYEGYVTIWTPEDDEPYGNASLFFDIQMSPTVLLSRDETGLAQCDMSFGDLPVYLSELECVDNLGYEPPVRDSWIPGISNVATVVVGGSVVLLVLSAIL